MAAEAARYAKRFPGPWGSAAWRLDQGRMSDADAAMARLYASEMLGRVTDQAMQIFDGMA
jgi:alkylation response protein AidB-like acyl-CoA dehydrogenase